MRLGCEPQHLGLPFETPSPGCGAWHWQSANTGLTHQLGWKRTHTRRQKARPENTPAYIDSHKPRFLPQLGLLQCNRINEPITGREPSPRNQDSLCPHIVHVCVCAVADAWPGSMRKHESVCAVQCLQPILEASGPINPPI